MKRILMVLSLVLALSPLTATSMVIRLHAFVPSTVQTVENVQKGTITIIVA